jgi:molybdopterin converting factor small subunit
MTMPVTLELPNVLAKLAGGARKVDAEGGTLGEVVSDVVGRYPGLGPRLRDANGQPYEFITIYLNDEDVRFQGGFAVPVKDGDVVTVVPAVAGG